MGIAAAVVGILLARVVPSHVAAPSLKIAAYLAGAVLALSGLLLVMTGIGKGADTSSNS